MKAFETGLLSYLHPIYFGSESNEALSDIRRDPDRVGRVVNALQYYIERLNKDHALVLTAYLTGISMRELMRQESIGKRELNRVLNQTLGEVFLWSAHHSLFHDWQENPDHYMYLSDLLYVTNVNPSDLTAFYVAALNAGAVVLKPYSNYGRAVIQLYKIQPAVELLYEDSLKMLEREYDLSQHQVASAKARSEAARAQLQNHLDMRDRLFERFKRVSGA